MRESRSMSSMRSPSGVMAVNRTICASPSRIQPLMKKAESSTAMSRSTLPHNGWSRSIATEGSGCRSALRRTSACCSARGRARRSGRGRWARPIELEHAPRGGVAEVRQPVVEDLAEIAQRELDRAGFAIGSTAPKRKLCRVSNGGITSIAAVSTLRSPEPLSPREMHRLRPRTGRPRQRASPGCRPGSGQLNRLRAGWTSTATSRPRALVDRRDHPRGRLRRPNGLETDGDAWVRDA